MKTIRVSSGSPYEERIGFSRAVRRGNVIAVSGTAPIAEDGSTTSPGDLYGQTVRCLKIIRDAVEQAGGRLEDVLRTQVYLTDASRWEQAGRAHGEVFGACRPACSFIQVAGLIDAEWLVEIEADCLIGDAL